MMHRRLLPGGMRTPRMEVLEARLLLDGDPIITEFLASNSTPWYPGIPDSDWDWIEIFNPTTGAIDLEGWHLTDDRDDLEMWDFPAVTLESGQYLVVFASNDYVDPTHPDDLHTNFALAKDGDYLALVRPTALDPDDIVSEYDFPRQVQDISYGLYEDAEVTSIISSRTDVDVLIPGGDIGGTWKDLGYTPAGWISGETGVGYETTVTGLAVDYYKANVSVGHLTTAESVISTPSMQSAHFAENIAFIDYYNTQGTGHYGNNLPFPSTTVGVNVDDFVIEVTGTVNIPTTGYWTFGVNSDDGFGLELDNGVDTFAISYPGTRGAADTVGVFNVTTAGPCQVRLVMYERGGGSEVELYAGSGSYGAWDSSMRLIGDTANGGLEVWSDPVAGGGSGGGFASLIRTDLQSVMEGANASAYIRIPFTVADPGAYENLTLRMKYDDGFVAYLNGTEVARRNAPAGTPAWNAAATAEHPNSQAVLYEDINITNHLGLLQTGENVLAIHGLNDGAADGDFLIMPELAEIGQVTLMPHYFSTLSPGEANSEGFIAFVADTEFDYDRGFYDAPFAVTITCDTLDADIYYTTDGSEPSESSGTLYNPASPVPVTTTTTLRAVAVKTDWESSNVDAQTYIFLNDVIRQPDYPAGFPTTWGTWPAEYGIDTDVIGYFDAAGNPIGGDLFGGVYASTIKDDLQAIPTMSLVMDVEDIFGVTGIYSNPNNEGVAWERPGSIEYFDPNAAGEFQVNCGVRIYGGVGRREQYEKHTLRLLFKSDYGPTKLDFPLFGEGATDSFDTIILRAGFNNAWHRHAASEEARAQYLRDAWMAISQLDMDQLGLHHTFVHLYINGLYWGLYDVVERCNADFGSSYIGGDKEEYDALNSYDRTIVDGTAEGWIAAQNLADASPVDMDAISQYVDIPNLIDYMILNFYAGNQDWDNHNWYSVNRRTEPGSGYKFLSWDAERTLESITGSDRTGIHEYNKPSNLYAGLRNDPEFRMLFADRVQRHFFNDGALTPEQTQARYQVLADWIDRAIVGESARWGDSSRELPYTRDAEWATERDRLLNQYFPQRTDVVLGFLKGAGLYPNTVAPTFHIDGAYQHGGTISAGDVLAITAPTGTIYYTLDGSDPRLPGGGINPDAGIIETGGTTTDLLAIDHVWSYEQTDTDLPDDWINVGYADGTWPTGPGLLYVEDASLPYPKNTPLTLGPETFYFRTHFTFDGNPAEVTELRLGVVVDDGAIVYLNGQELERAGMNDGYQPGHYDLSDRTVGNAVYESYTIPAGQFNLVQGDNVLAVEVHQISTTSTDVVWGMELEAVTLTPPGQDQIVLDDSAHVKARVFSGTEWSALNEATFLLDTVKPLRITEIMYNPAVPTPAEVAAGFTDNDLFEYLELRNIGDEPLDVGGIHFTDGITFTFGDLTLGAGEYTLIVKNQAAFEARYGTGFNIAGEFALDDNLNNGGEDILLEGPVGGVIHDFDFEDGWFGHTDGDGFSLVVRDANQDLALWDSKEGWQASEARGGSPAAGDAAVAPGSVIISELLTHTDEPYGDWIELHNTTGAPINIGGWFLSDDDTDDTTLASYEIAAGTWIGAGGYLVFTQVDHFGVGSADPGSHIGFGLSELGDEEVCLSSQAPDGSPGGYREDQRFGAADRERTFGLYTKTTGGTDFVAMADATWQDQNALPYVGPVVINEIMYHPDVGGDEFLELLNLTGSAVSLQGWTFVEGLGGFEFQAGASIAADGYLLLVQTDPATFRSGHNVPAGVPIYQYSGSLDNGGETLDLAKPGDPEYVEVAPGVWEWFTPYIRAERVTYNDKDPWPAYPDGSGSALIRLFPSLYGNDVINWGVSTYGGSPGRANAGTDVTPPRLAAVGLNQRPGRTVGSIEPSAIGVRTIDLTFNEGVVLDPAAVTVQTVTFVGEDEIVTDTLAPTVQTLSATAVRITLGDPVGAVDTWVKVTLNALGVADAAGNRLDGEPALNSSGMGYIYDAGLDLPTGNGMAGGNAVFYVGSLRADMRGYGPGEEMPDGEITPWDITGFTQKYLSDNLDADMAGYGPGQTEPDGDINPWDISGFTSRYSAAMAAGTHLVPLPTDSGQPLAVGSPAPLPLVAESIGAEDGAGAAELTDAPEVALLAHPTDGPAPDAETDAAPLALETALAGGSPADAVTAGLTADSDSPAAPATAPWLPPGPDTVAADVTLEADGGLVDLLAAPALQVADLA
ncbi:MAG TPA: lamin tail domain-containing protein [Phycisphaerae bacterium]|nr:lamin tail domain-containing protein [Phycisphaerae bacterium]